MPITLPPQTRKDAIASLQQYADRNLPEPLGDLAAGLLLDFFLQDIAPAVYNQAIHDAQTRLHTQLTELDAELYEAPFTYWQKQATRKPRAR